MRVLDIPGGGVGYFPENADELAMLASVAAAHEKLGGDAKAAAALIATATDALPTPPEAIALMLTIEDEKGARSTISVLLADVQDVRAEKRGSSILVAGQERVFVLEAVGDVKVQVDFHKVDMPALADVATADALAVHVEAVEASLARVIEGR